MKQTLLSLVLIAASTSAFADSPGAPLLDPKVVIDETVKSAGNDEWAFGLMMFAVFIMTAIK